MDTEKKLNIVRGIGEFAIGWVIGSIAISVIQPKSAVEKALTMVGSSAVAIAIGGAFDKEFNETCEAVFDVEFD